MKLSIVVLAKQVPDTRNVGPDTMTPEGTVNRSALPAIFNPEDLNALEQALRLKDQNPGTKVTVITMGPGRAAEVIREAMYRGADNGYLLTDRAFAGADTLATSYALSAAIKQVAPDADLIISGRQAIDGDTAQVGPQVAEKLNLNQITYIEEILSCQNGLIRVKRHIDGGVETVESALPCVLTVNGSAAPCRPRNVRLVMKYKRAMAPIELEQGTGYCDQPYASEYEKKNYLKLGQLNCADIDADLNQCGLAGSPTKVKSVENIAFQAKENKVLTGSDEDINSLVKELLASHAIG
ncbi:MAG: electron transfer flavoprotein subunit beta/FixA family protein [Bacteroidaceae bacterium]|nr:electron transfer flavoprotein subunit beta/FixA family protein [Bacteroidaceae bacterium]